MLRPVLGKNNIIGCFRVLFFESEEFADLPFCRISLPFAVLPFCRISCLNWACKAANGKSRNEEKSPPETSKRKSNCNPYARVYPAAGQYAIRGTTRTTRTTRAHVKGKAPTCNDKAQDRGFRAASGDEAQDCSAHLQRAKKEAGRLGGRCS